MRRVFLVVCLIWLAHTIHANTDEELERYLREISVEKSDNSTSQTEAAAKNVTVITSAKTDSDDPDADKFVDDLKKISEEAEERGNRTQGQAVVYKTSEQSNTTLDDDYSSNNQSNLLYMSQLNGSSIRAQIVIDLPWEKDLIYPSYNKYALLESSLSSAFEQAYENYEPFINFHLISFIYRNDLSFFCDFILNFKTQGRHLGPFLKLIQKERINEIPISTPDFVNAYVVEINRNSYEFCTNECTKDKCNSPFCPPACCNYTKTKNLSRGNTTENVTESVQKSEIGTLKDSQETTKTIAEVPTVQAIYEAPSLVEKGQDLSNGPLYSTYNYESQNYMNFFPTQSESAQFNMFDTQYGQFPSVMAAANNGLLQRSSAMVSPSLSSQSNALVKKEEIPRMGPISSRNRPRTANLRRRHKQLPSGGLFTQPVYSQPSLSSDASFSYDQNSQFSGGNGLEKAGQNVRIWYPKIK